MSGVRTDASGNVILTANGVDAVKANVSGVITAGAQGVSGLDVATVNQVLGVGQTWQNVIGSRALGTTYTNSTGRPIFVMVSAQLNTSTNINVTLGGTFVGALTNNNAAAIAIQSSFVVPNGATYLLATSVGSAILQAWGELRT